MMSVASVTHVAAGAKPVLPSSAGSEGVENQLGPLARIARGRCRARGSCRGSACALDDPPASFASYSFLAEARGARRVVAVDNEQYVEWVRARFGVTLDGGVGFRAIAGLLGSPVEYRRMDALDVRELGERFDVMGSCTA